MFQFVVWRNLAFSHILPLQYNTFCRAKFRYGVARGEELTTIDVTHPCDRKINICYIIDRLTTAGTEGHLLTLISNLDRSRFNPLLVLLDGDDKTSMSLVPRECETLRLGIRSLRRPSTLARAFHLARTLRRNRIDILQTYFPDSTMFGVVAGRLARVRAIFGSRRNIGHWMNSADVRRAKLFNRFIDQIIANCQAARDAVIKQEGARPENVLVIPNGVDIKRFSGIQPLENKPSGETIRIGMVGNLRPVKGPDLLIRSARHVCDRFPNCKFELAGGGDTTPYRVLIEKFELGNCVRLLGTVNDVPRFLSSLDLAVLPSRAEGLSNSLLEYMAAGRPIIATNVGGTPELIENGIHGLLVSPDWRALGKAITTLVEQRHFSLQMAQAARERVERSFSLTNTMRSYERLYTASVFGSRCRR